MKMIKGHPDYCITPTGKVWSQRYRRYIGHNHPNGDGYLCVTLAQKKFLIHRLVAEAYCNRRGNRGVVRHLDGDKLNNDMSNLAWGTPAENAEDAVKHGVQTRGERVPQSRFTAEQVRQIRKDPRGYAPIARDYGVTDRTIKMIKLRVTWGWLEDSDEASGD